MTGKLIVKGDIEVNGKVDSRDVLGDGKKLDDTIGIVVPIIKSVKGKNGAMCTTGSTFTLVINANPSISEYRVACEDYDSGWVTNHEITISGLSEIKLYTVTVEAKNSLGNTDKSMFSFFKL